ncbi:hypothetical protein RHMOL_Rhmol07G0052400 [Rhododendron molle]|uniref:Uncharacterized protein n=1 Tax=Rhododendron molle TaxID=49168 RepID=A0ACC0MYF1_RHOML|nr:hypothetical protein RHMOL_Rhmol07G0052400 [Rhododendron molle]
MHDSLVCNGFKDIFLYIHNQTIMHPLITHTISKPTLYNPLITYIWDQKLF